MSVISDLMTSVTVAPEIAELEVFFTVPEMVPVVTGGA